MVFSTGEFGRVKRRRKVNINRFSLKGCNWYRLMKYKECKQQYIINKKFIENKF